MKVVNFEGKRGSRGQAEAEAKLGQIMMSYLT